MSGPNSVVASTSTGTSFASPIRRPEFDVSFVCVVSWKCLCFVRSAWRVAVSVRNMDTSKSSVMCYKLRERGISLDVEGLRSVVRDEVQYSTHLRVCSDDMEYLTIHVCYSPSTTTSLIPFFLVLRFRLRSRSSRNLGKTSGRTLSMTLGSTGLLGLSSQVWTSAGLSRYMRHSRTEYLVMRRYRRMGAMAGWIVTHFAI